MGKILEGRVAVVTGAGRGIGRAIAMLMADEGARVVVNDLGGTVDGKGASNAPATEVVRQIKDKGGTAVASLDSVATMAGGQKIIETAADNFGRIDILVNTAGIFRPRPIFEMTEEDWDAVIAVHLKGTFVCTRYASVLMKNQGYGRIINFVSRVGLWGNPERTNYGAAKAGIAGFTMCAALDMGQYGITVNAISPRASTRSTAASTLPNMPTEDPGDVAPMVVYLASQGSGGINGRIFSVVGGEIGLFSRPELVKTVRKRGRWTLEELCDAVPSIMG